VVPFFARYFAGFATDADRRIGEETNLNIVAHVRMPTLIRAVCTFADHENEIRKAGKQENTAQETGVIRAIKTRQPFPVLKTWPLLRIRFSLGSLFIILIPFLRSRGLRRFVLFGKTALRDVRSLARFAVQTC
jgi:hypothetical protein